MMQTKILLVTLLVILVILGVVLLYPHGTQAPVITTPSAPTAPVATSTSPTAKIVTQADMGSTIHLAKNEQLILQFGSTLSWRFEFNPAGVITESHGIYTATAAGTTTLHASGAPICNPNQACPQFIQEVVITFVVQ